jgi:hypothetical protein
MPGEASGLGSRAGRDSACPGKNRTCAHGLGNRWRAFLHGERVESQKTASGARSRGRWSTCGSSMGGSARGRSTPSLAQRGSMAEAASRACALVRWSTSGASAREPGSDGRRRRPALAEPACRGWSVYGAVRAPAELGAGGLHDRMEGMGGVGGGVKRRPKPRDHASTGPPAVEAGHRRQRIGCFD